MTNPMDVYERIKHLGPEAKADADTFMGELTKNYTAEHPAPPEAIQQGLEGILAKHSAPNSHNNGKETHPATSHATDRMQYAAGLAFVLIALAAFAHGVPYMPPPLY